MKQYILTVYQPDGDPPPAGELEKIMQKVEAWNEELKAADAWVFTGGLHPADTATVVRLRDGETLTTDGPYTEGKEHIGGFTIIRVADLDAALKWAAEFTRITTLPVEVRPMLDGD
ncbi:YciI family protein [Actinoallomurus sp. NPDC052308]|uniref:YciI family protein n=1 Tax=Actinoallomurus sp. NPDC052308 TaxID=3155530 RepID=UPI003433C14C